MSATSNNMLATQNDYKEIKDKVKVESKQLPVRVFEARESVLTEILKNKHITVVYNLFAAVFVGTCINTVLSDYLRKGELDLGLGLIIKSFRNFDKFVVLWSCVFCSTLGAYFSFIYWARIRFQLISKSLCLFLWDTLWITFFIIYVVGLLYFPARAAINCDFGVATSGAALAESLRLLMKVYAFVRTKSPHFLKNKSVKNSPKFSEYIYFLFAPTLVYRDSYPRSKGNIQWRLVASNFLEVIVAIFFCSFIYKKSYILSLKEYGLKPYDWKDILITIFHNTHYAMLCVLTQFYIVLHLWQNAFAEMLQFSDRLFYKDWWTSSSYSRYYRTWNCLVHDWLYTYIYTDFYEVVVPKNKIAAKVMVFFLSSLIHEYILSVSVGFFVPSFMIQFFIFGTVMSFVKFKNEVFGNVFLLYTFALGCSIMYTFNIMEYYSRINCGKDGITSESFFSLKLFSCNPHLL